MAFDDLGLGISFAPTQQQSEMAARQGDIEGIPEAIRVLSLRMPRWVGARAPVNSALVQPNAGAGSGGYNPYVSAVLQSIAQQIGGMPTSIPPIESVTGPSMPVPSQTGPVRVPGLPPTQEPGPVWNPTPAPPKTPRTHWQGPQGGTAGYGENPRGGERLPGEFTNTEVFPSGRGRGRFL